MTQQIDLKHFKEKLEDELARLEAELATVGRKNPDSPTDWEAKPDEMDILDSDENELADKFESLEDNAGVVGALEEELEEVRHALEKIENGSYGICEESGKPIPIERLEIYPAARTLVEFAD